MSQTVTSVATNLPSVTINDSNSNSSVYAATTSTVTTISPCPPQQQYSPPQSSVPSQYSQLPVYNTEGFQATQKIKLLTRPQTANGTPGNEAPLSQAALMEQLASGTSNVVVGVSSATGLPVMPATLSGEENNEWQPSVALVMPSERCDDENPSVNLQEFLFNTMRSPQDNRDRVFLLQLESMFTSYINDPMQTGTLTLPPDTSYHRMLAHRVAAYFGLKHSVDPTGNSVVVWKIAESKVPEQRFEDYIPVEEKDSLEPKKQILKRSKELVASVGSSQKQLEQQPSGITNADMKSIEEKQEAYDRAKARIFSQEPSTSQPRNGSRQMLLSDPAENINNSGNLTEHNDVGKLPPEGDSRDDTSPGSRSRSSSQGSNMSANRTTPSRNRSTNRRPQPAKYPSRQSYVPAGYVPNLATQPVSPGMLYYQQQQQAAMLQQYSTAAAAAAAAAGYPQYLQYAHNPMMPAAAAALYSQPNMNSYAFQPQPQPQQLYAMPGGQVYSVLANPAMRPPAMYMHSQQQGSFHHPHLQPTAAAATAGIIRPVPQHAQPQANRFVSKPVHGPGSSWKPTFPQQAVAAAATQQLRANNNNVNTTTAAGGNFQEYQLANYIESNLTLNDESRQETESPEQQQPTTSSSSQKQLTQQGTQTQYAVPQEQDVQNATTAPESVAAIKFFPHMTSSGQVQYIATASPMINSHGYQNQFTGVVATATNPYSYQLQNAPSTPPINMINPSQPVLFSPPSSGPPTPSHYIPQGLFSPPPQPAILVGMGNQQISNLVTQQNSAEAITQTQQSEESGDNRNGSVVETNALGSQVADASSPAKTVVSTSNGIEAAQKRQTLSNQQQEAPTTATVTTNATTTTTTTVNKHKELNTGNAHTSAGLPPRFQQRSGGSTTRYQNQRHPSNRQNTKQVAMDSTNVAMTTNHYGPLSTNALPKREPLLPTPPTVACIIPHEPVPSGGQEILEILNFPAEGPQYQAALVELKKLNASILNIKKVNGAAIFVAKFESAHQAQMAMQQTIKQQQPYQLVIPSGQHSKIIHTALSRRQQSSNRTS